MSWMVTLGAVVAALGVHVWALESTWVRPRVAAAFRTDVVALRRRGRVVAVSLTLIGTTALLWAINTG